MSKNRYMLASWFAIKIKEEWGYTTNPKDSKCEYFNNLDFAKKTAIIESLKGREFELQDKKLKIVLLKN